MKIRLRSLVLLAVVCGSGGLLLHISQNVQEAQDQLEKLQAHNDQEKESIILLQAEWEALNTPSRLEVLAQKYLDLKPPMPQDIQNQMQDAIPVLHMPVPEETLPSPAQPVAYQAGAQP